MDTHLIFSPQVSVTVCPRHGNQCRELATSDSSRHHLSLDVQAVARLSSNCHSSFVSDASRTPNADKFIERPRVDADALGQ
jgi:hypothetical protein